MRESIKIRLFLVGLLVLVDLEVSQRVGVLVGGNDSQEVLDEPDEPGFPQAIPQLTSSWFFLRYFLVKYLRYRLEKGVVAVKTSLAPRGDKR
jgi:hypothetical protein